MQKGTGNMNQDKDGSTEYIVLSYRQDRHGNVRKTKLGRGFLGRNGTNINVSLEAAPLTNQDGECWITLVPYDPNFSEKYE